MLASAAIWNDRPLIASIPLKHSLLRLVYWAAFYSGIDAFFYYLNRRRQVVLAYHNVVPDALYDNSLHLGVSHSASVFERHLQIIDKRWPAAHDTGSCVITFDDGYANQCTIAAPLLERYGRKGVFFVTLGLVGSRVPLWTDRLLMWFSYVPAGRYHVLGHRLDIDDAAARSASWRVIWKQILDNYSSLESTVRAIDAAFPFDKLPIDARLKALRFEAVTLEQIADLIRKGHRIGCHSCEHDVLSRLSRAALERDFARCESEMDRVFNCDFYCYPFGGPIEVTEREQALCRKSKFRRAFMNMQRIPSGLTPDEYALPRLSLPNTTNRYVIAAKLSGFEHALRQVLSRGQANWRALLVTLRAVFLPREIRDADAPL